MLWPLLLTSAAGLAARPDGVPPPTPTSRLAARLGTPPPRPLPSAACQSPTAPGCWPSLAPADAASQGYPWVLGRKDVEVGQVLTLTGRVDAVAEKDLLPIM